MEPRNEGNIDGERNAVRALARACELIRTGNKKKLLPLQLPEDQDTSIAFSKGTGNIAKLFIMESRVRFATGRPDSGAESIVDGMTFGNRLGSQLVDVLSASAKNAMFFAQVEDSLPMLSSAGARRLSNYFEAMAKAPSPYLNAIKLEFDEIVRDPSKHLAEMSEETDYWTPPDEMLALSTEQKRDYAKRIAHEFSKLAAHADETFAKEERFWKLNLNNEDPIIEHALIAGIYDNVPSIAARYRTQFRLAALHCRVVEFKRTHNRWPEKLTELGGREIWYDPASGGPFFYQKLTDQSYLLYSLGTPETGRIDLRWRPPIN